MTNASLVGTAGRLPISAWPAEVFPFEPSYGFFQRTAAVNRQLSARSFAETLLLNGRNLDPQQMLAFCLTLPTAGVEQLINFTPRVDEWLWLNGQPFRPSDWSAAHPRVCVGCLAEQPYYRNWFDLRVMRSCPLHGQLLVSGEGASKLAWWHPQVGVAPNGVPMSEYTVAADDGDWERYVLGRMGVMAPSPTPLLDPMAMYDVVEAAAVIGRFDIASRQLHGSEQGRRARAVSTGFHFLNLGEAGVKAVLSTYVQAFLRGQAKTRARFAFDTVYRDFRQPLQRLRDNPLASLVHDGMLDAARAHGVYRRRARGASADDGDMLTQEELARKFGLKNHHIRAITVALKLRSATVDRRQCRFFTAEDAALIGATLADLVPRAEAAQLAGLSWREFVAFGEAGLIAPLIRKGSGSIGGDHFRRSQIQALIAQGEFAAWRVSRGRDGWRLKARRHANLDSLTYADAAVALQANLATIPILASHGYLQAIDAGHGTRPRITRASLKAFAAEYVAAKAYAAVLSSSARWVVIRLKKIGVEQLLLPTPACAFIKRDQADAAVAQLGFLTAADPVAQFWEALTIHLARVSSVTRLVASNGEAASLTTGGRRSRACIRLSERGVHLELEAQAKRSPRRFRILKAMAPRLAEGWPLAAIEHDEESVRVCDQQKLDWQGADRVAAIAWITGRMETVRWLFQPKSAEEIGSLKTRRTRPLSSQVGFVSERSLHG